jgi:tetratricopeptide (TPR) repeat protein
MIVAYLLLGEVARQERNFDEAVQHLQFVLNMKPRFMMAYNRLGRVYLEKGDYDSAKKAFETALKLNPFVVSSRIGLAEALIQKNELEEAVEIISNLSQLTTGSAEIAKQLEGDENLEGQSESLFDETSNLDQLLYAYALVEQEFYLYPG